MWDESNDTMQLCPGPESEDWPADEAIMTPGFPTPHFSSGMKRPFQAYTFQVASRQEQESLSNDEMDSSTTQSSSATLTSDGDESQTTTLSQGDMVVNLATKDDREVINLIDRMEYIDDSFDPTSGRHISTITLRDNSVIDLEEYSPEQRIKLRPSMSVLLKDGSYLRIEKVIDDGGEQLLSGRYLLHTRDNRVNAFVPKVAGELVWVTTVTTPIPVDQVQGTRQIRFTNARTTWKPRPYTDFLCRLKLTEGLRSSLTTRVHERHHEAEHAVEYLTLDETDEGYGWSANDLRDDWRGVGETTLFGDAELHASSLFTNASTPAVIDLVDPSPVFIDLTESRDRTYTFGDAFCGAGGTSCGARQAGLSVRWGCDMDADAIETYRLNFDAAAVYHARFDQLMVMRDAELRVDVCHCSPPCQPFSPAHTVNNQVRDELNSACIFAAHNLIQRARPRVLTMEETSGLYERYKETMHRVILDVIEGGYSVRWSILDCFHYGVPQCRKRLLIIAAGPGETLPNFPPETHGLPGAGLELPITIYDAINDIPDNASNHDVGKQLQRWERTWHAPYNAFDQAKTITCSGGEANYHPSGRRRFTEREVACLQTFPLDFEFSSRHVRKQIGNAVPTKFAEAVYREIARSLRQTDEEELLEREKREREQLAARIGM